MALNFNVSQPYVNKVLAKHDVKYRKRRSCPRYAPGQAERAKSRAGDLRRNFFLPSKSTQIVMDDESYFALKDDNINGNSGFYISPECPMLM